METAPLKSFATSARTELIREVGARITAVLAQGSPERVEQLKAVSALERAIVSAGDGDKGKAHVANKVAYTWFNRIIALRFMDANGYTGIGVVSPAADQVGQPEVLAAAKRGQVDEDVVKGPDAAIITGLLNGTRQPRPGVDAQAEAYALLLADYCRFWNTAMPFMFEREGDYTELLIPANLLADDSVLSRSVAVLTDDVCRDVEVIGWLYQFYISERKDEVFAGFKKNKKAGADEIPAATQLFTPHWIVRYLVENSLGRLWMLNRPSSGLASQMDYYIAPVDEETDFLKITKPEELKVIDPACGSGHMLTYAFDLLYAIYEEEGHAPSEIPGLILSNNLYGIEIDPRAAALAAFALTMKASAKRKLFLKNPVEPHICVLEPISFSVDELAYLVTKSGDRYAEEAFWSQFAEADTFGALIQPDPEVAVRLKAHLETLEHRGDMLMADAIERAHRAVSQVEYLLPRYGVVVANPPYMGSGNMGSLLTDFAKREYPTAKADLMTMFMRRGHDLVRANGYWAMIDLPSWMFLTTFAAFRRWLLSECWMQSIVHLGRGVFGSDFGSVALVCKRSQSDVGRVGVYRRLFEQHVDVRTNDKIRALFFDAKYNRFELAQTSFTDLPGQPIAYWLSEPLRKAFSSHLALGSTVAPKQGIKTGNNERFLRYWFEVGDNNLGRNMLSREEALASGKGWFPCQKGGQYRRWYGNDEYVVNWFKDGEEIRNLRDAGTGKLLSRPQNLEWLFKPGVTWGTISSGPSSFRICPPGSISESKGAIAYTSDEAKRLAALGLLNSSVSAALLSAISPTVDYGEGAIGKLPFSSSLLDAELAQVVRECVELSRSDWLRSETALDFAQNELVAKAAKASDLASLVRSVREDGSRSSESLRRAETEVNRRVAAIYGLVDEVQVDVPAHRVSLASNDVFRYGEGRGSSEYDALARADLARDLVSYAVGCMLGRYSLDEQGLILAGQGATLQDYLAKVPTPTFTPDADNVIPIVDGDWFEDDAVGLFRRFLRTAFGDQHFEENLKFVTESLGVKNLRDYFITRAGKSKFYDDHVQRYKKRPIYWLFSSPKGSFNALIYMHRYTPSTVSTVLTYLREYVTKLESALQHAERAGNAKEADRLRKILVELNEYEHDTLYPKASENVVIDLDDGVKTNYPKFGAALKKITGLEASGD
ncbi:BREX-1 system adenine-specific DNA-methyltransferase PglX [Kribbella sp. NPDC050459]|uniref:BREX-1 system adenine-specific DNA-methyltransferase PglX n=1 Tax=Kribbella sp. NPDC050459 TaxID=3155785 RepID=UPI0033CBB63C